MEYQFEPSSFAGARAESIDTIEQLRNDAIEFYGPQNSQELFAVTRIALEQAKLLRCALIDAGYHTSFMNECLRPNGVPHNLIRDAMTDGGKVTVNQNRSLCLATGFDRLSRESDSFQLFLRYQTLCERLYRRAIEDFERLKKLRGAQQQSAIPLVEPAIEPPELLPPPPEGYRLPTPYDSNYYADSPLHHIREKHRPAATPAPQSRAACRPVTPTRNRCPVPARRFPIFGAQKRRKVALA